MLVGGLSMSLHISLKENLVVQVGFLLRAARIASKALVKYILEREGRYTIGIQFLDLDSESAGYIDGLYAFLVMLHKHRLTLISSFPEKTIARLPAYLIE